ncbi:TonB family protein [Deferrisoma camini]|uniref:TonB family protein n=1 Tax=Deferrisoma camini TaxID=1035120 RepID=UPI00046CA110|nr:TonB family protein [Deferrisoma camini]
MEPIDLRSDLLPPLIALALSVAVHLAAAWWVPSPPKPDRSEPEAVVVEMRELPAPAPPDKPKPKPRRPPKPRPKAAARPRPKPAPKPQPARQPPSPQPAPRPAPEPPPLVQETTAKAPARAEPPAAPPEPESAKPAPRLSDLLPSPREIAVQARSGAPDPAGGAQEATLWLGQTDTRYRGYLERVQNAIDVSWRWKEALLGAGRPGSVVIGFTLTPDGRAEEVKVSRSSGSPLLDEEAAAAVRRAVFPAFPTHWSIRRLRLFAQFDYRLE